MAKSCYMPFCNGRFKTKLMVDFGFIPPPAVILAKAGIQHVTRAKRKSNISDCHVPLMPRGSHLFCFAKKGYPKKATPTIVPGLRRGRL